jgi:hypothetical protein
MRRFALVLALAVSSTVAQAKPNEAKPRMALVLLEKPGMPKGEEVVSAYGKIAAKGGPAVTAKMEKEALVLTWANGATVMVALLPMPVPLGEAEEHFRYSITALHTDRKLAPHRAHLVVFAGGESQRSAEELARFTRILAAIVQASKAVGVYWGDAGATHEAQTFIGIASVTDPALLLPLWCGFELVDDNSGRVSLLTVGMRAQLDLMDLHLTAPKAQTGDAIIMVYELLAYELHRGSPVPDGETVGRTAEQKLTVRHVPSPAPSKETVWRVDLP